MMPSRGDFIEYSIFIASRDKRTSPFFTFILGLRFLYLTIPCIGAFITSSKFLSSSSPDINIFEKRISYVLFLVKKVKILLLVNLSTNKLYFIDRYFPLTLASIEVLVKIVE